MRILLLSYHAPCDATPDASRARKLAGFLIDRGHDVRVLSSSEPPSRGVAGDHVLLTPNRDALEAQQGQTMRGKIAGIIGGGRRKSDREQIWSQSALAAATELFMTWMPDVIYATCPPNATALVADQLSRLSTIPVVTELRERWTPEGLAKRPDRRSQLDNQKERDILNRAAAIVTVSPVWAENYANRFGADKVTIAMDGFDPADYPLVSPVPSDQDRKTLRLHYAVPAEGAPRDLGVFFDGIAALGAGATDIRVTLGGCNTDAAFEMARDAGVERQIDFCQAVSRKDVIARQYGADALVLATPNDPADAGTIPAELFDYIGTRRPVIAMGYSKGVAAEIIRKRDLGIFSNEPKVIANRLAKLLAKKRAVGVVPFLPEAVRENATVAAQFSGLEPMLYGVVGSAPLSVAAE